LEGVFFVWVCDVSCYKKMSANNHNDYMLVAFPNGSEGAAATMKMLEKSLSTSDNLAGKL
jgi:hypothetical protein